MKKFAINHYSTYSNLKASIVERVIRTLKSRMWKQFSLQGNYKWLDILDKIVSEYNNTIHSVTGIAPAKVTKQNEKEILNRAYSQLKVVDPKPAKFQVNDYVRISKYRDAFQKGYTPNWSNEIFKVTKVRQTNPRVYLLTDSNGEEIQGTFYTSELQKVQFPDIYLVEKILKRKKGQVYIKWLGLPSKFNSWVNSSELV